MNNKKTTLLNNGLIWFGAAVSIAEILTGTYIAPLGFSKGLAAIIIGHIIGCIILFLAGIIGGVNRKSSMETVRMSYGKYGAMMFSILNVMQLVGWTAIMIYDGAAATKGILNTGTVVWCVVIGLLTILWIAIGVNNLGKLNIVAVAALFLLSIWMSKGIFSVTTVSKEYIGSITFGAAVELGVAMPLSWLPLISDYTREAEKPKKATFISVLVYFLVSIWMYTIGMGAVICTGKSEISQIIMNAGPGIAGLVIIILSTVTTTFMDAYSAGVSMEAVSSKFNSKKLGILITVIGIIAASIFPMDNITQFLYLIGSVFAPMVAIQISDYFILKKEVVSKNLNIRNFFIWLIGFIMYRFLMHYDFVLGNTLPDMIVIILISLLAEKLSCIYSLKQ